MNRKHRLIQSLLGAILVLFLIAGIASAADGYDIPNFVIGGGGERSEGGIYVVHGTVGQSLAGLSTGVTSELCAGFWCGVEAQYGVFLPVVLRDAS